MHDTVKWCQSLQYDSHICSSVTVADNMILISKMFAKHRHRGCPICLSGLRPVVGYLRQPHYYWWPGNFSTPIEHPWQFWISRFVYCHICRQTHISTYSGWFVQRLCGLPLHIKAGYSGVAFIFSSKKLFTDLLPSDSATIWKLPKYSSWHKPSIAWYSAANGKPRSTLRGHKDWPLSIITCLGYAANTSLDTGSFWRLQSVLIIW